MTSNAKAFYLGAPLPQLHVVLQMGKDALLTLPSVKISSQIAFSAANSLQLTDHVSKLKLVGVRDASPNSVKMPHSLIPQMSNADPFTSAASPQAKVASSSRPAKR